MKLSDKTFSLSGQYNTIMAKDALLPISDTPSFSCDQCGACCKTFFVQVSENDAEREPRIRDLSLPVETWLQNEEWRYRLHPLPFYNGCCFLGDSQLCTIYETRPTVCRKFAAGSTQCQEARSLVGLAPLSPISATNNQIG